ncbi:MAG: IS1380 family transposase [Candidatus Accumulibacter sp.]|nr:IS1380 family transposase [Accumulibacter sp.]
MKKLAQTVLPFKVEATEEQLTANAGLALFGEFIRGLGLNRWLATEMPPGSARGYAANAFVTPLVLMLTGGGRSLEDLRTLKNDTALNQVLKQDVLPSTDAMGDWLRRTGTRTGLDGLGRINRRAVATRIRQIGIQAHTLDGDASQIVAEKEAAHVTYKGEQGDMPMISHPAEAGVVIHDEFRKGNIALATQNLEFIQACEARLPKGHRIAQVRLDSAGYQADIFNYCEDTGKTFAIGGRLDARPCRPLPRFPKPPEEVCRPRRRRNQCRMNDTRKSFRLIVVKYPRQVELFDDAPKYPVIASNRVESAADILIWYRQRGEVSENGINELKIGFGMERMPCGQFSANAAFFRIGVIAHRIHLSGNIVLAHRRGAGGFECRCDGKQTIPCSPLSDLGSQELHEIFHLGHLLRRDCSDLRHQALFNCSIHHHPPRLRRAQHAAAACSL